MRQIQQWGDRPPKRSGGVDWVFVLGWVVILSLTFGFWYWIIGSTIKAALSP